MFRYLLIFLISFSFCFGAHDPQVTTFDNGGGDNAWSTASNWDGTVPNEIPEAGDTVVITTATCILDIPATPSLVSITTTGVGAILTEALGNKTINSDIICGGTAVALTIQDTGIVTINGSVSFDGTGTAAACILLTNTGGEAKTLIITGDVTGGGNSSTDYGINCGSLDDITVTIGGNLTGGATTSASGLVGTGNCIWTVTGTVRGGGGDGTSVDAKKYSRGMYWNGDPATKTCVANVGTVAFANYYASPVAGVYSSITIGAVTVNGVAIGSGTSFESGTRNFE
jgi:hypothetical protein